MSHFTFNHKTIIATSILGLFMTATLAEAARPRSTADRRHRPEGGFWEKGPSSSSSSYSSNRSFFRTTPQMNYAPRTIVSPQPMIAPSQNIVRQPSYVPQAPIVSRPVVQPQTVVTTQADPCIVPPAVTSQPVVQQSFQGEVAPHISQPAPVYNR